MKSREQRAMHRKSSEDRKQHPRPRTGAEIHELPSCEEEMFDFAKWEQRDEVIQYLELEESKLDTGEHINRNVMDRIYAEQSWLMPVEHKNHYFTRHFRRNVMIVVAACLAMFMTAFLVFAFNQPEPGKHTTIADLTGLVDTVNASGDGLVVKAGLYSEIPVASISEPFVMMVVPTYPQYYVALSLLGIIMTLLILNWLTRTRQ